MLATLGAVALVPATGGGMTVQLWPFMTTTNKGGVYKAWLTPVDKYDAEAGKHGFVNRWSKTDNFKCDVMDEPPPPPPGGDAGPPPPPPGGDAGPPPEEPPPEEPPPEEPCDDGEC